MIEINPIELRGKWDKGYALDHHSIKSIPIGEDPFGHMQFNTTYTPIGELLYKFKYKNQYDCLHEIANAVVAFLQSNKDIADFQTILPVPPSKKNRAYQPAFEIAEEASKKLGVFYSDHVLEKVKDVEYKNLQPSEKKSMQGMIRQIVPAKYKINVLLIDDIYDTGSTLRQCTETLRQDPNIDKIYVLTVTKKRK